MTQLILGGCIRREPRQASEAASAPLTASPTAGSTSEVSPKPTGNYGKVSGVDLLGKQGVSLFVTNGETTRVEVSRIAVVGQPFVEALRVAVKEGSANSWDVQVQARTVDGVEKGDVLLATFYLRTEWTPDESAEGQTEFVFELARPPWAKSASYPVRASREWKKVYVRFQAQQAYRAGEAQMIFRLGYGKETIQIGGITVENFGKQLALADLPTTRTTYQGFEPTAAWRQGAADRIEKIRKAELRVVVKDAQGGPVPSAEVQVNLVRHQFGFGTCAPASALLAPGDERYRKILGELFNTVTLENDLKWAPLAGDWGPSYTLARARAGVDYLRSQNLAVRGHVMVWPGWENLPRSLRAFDKDPSRLRIEVENHIRQVGTAMQGKLTHWDVLNEPYDNRALLDILGREVAVDWFRLAHSVDPTAKLFINDYAILSGGGGQTAHRDYYEQFIRMLLDHGAPVDGIGMQGHFGSSLTGPEELYTLLDRYAKLGRPIWVTEYDVVTDDEALAGDYTRDFYTILFSHPAVEGIVMWGFWDGLHWKNNAPLYRQDFSLKPAGEALRELLLETWHTRATGITDNGGAYSVRGYLGSYEIVVSHAGQKKQLRADLSSGGTVTEVVL